jgi:L-lysine 2,3-aminomutase
MNIKDTIKELGLENENLPRILTQRVNTVVKLQEQIQLAEQEVEDDPSEENKSKLEEVKTYASEYFDDAKDQLTVFKQKLDKKREVHNAEPITDGDDDADKQKGKGLGLGALLIGGVLLVATLGAVNVMNKK